MKSPFTLAAAALAAAAALLLACAAPAAAQEPKRQPINVDALLKDKENTVSLQIQDVPLNAALKMLAKQYPISFITAKDANITVSAHFKDVTLDQALNSLVTINGFSYRVKGAVIEIYAARPTADVAEQPRVQVFELQYASAEKLKTLLKPFLSKASGKIEAEISRNALIVYDLPSPLETITKVIEKIDKAEPQVTISAEIIEASLETGESLGIDWKTRIAATGSLRPITWPFSARDSHNKYVPANDPDVGVDAEFAPNRSFPYTVRDDFTFGTLDATGLRAVLDVLKTTGNTNLIANPEITTLNNRQAKITIGNTVPVPIYTTNLETGVSAVTGFEEIETGTILIVTPRVNAGGKSVTLEVKPEISEILEFKGQFDERPIVASRKAETTVRLRDGETLVIGGLVSEKTEEVINKIPILGDIPILGWLFKSKSLQKQKTTLYIFVTPRIILGDADPDRATKAVKRLKKTGLRDTDTGADDIRNPATSPFRKTGQETKPEGTKS